MQKLLDITFTAKTDTGLKRKQNEDYFVCSTLWNSYILTAVIDGVGGYTGGDIAAEMAGKTVMEYLNQRKPMGDLCQMLHAAVVEANNNIIDMHFQKNEYKDMACVLTVILINPNEGLIYMAHVGDTRLYEYIGGVLNKLSHDHSPVGMREEMGLLTEEAAMNHPMRNVIERCLGEKELPLDTDYVETATFSLKKGATYLLCSDGLTDMVNSTHISNILSSEETVDEKAQNLIDSANELGGNDNITVLLIEVPNGSNDFEQPFLALQIPNGESHDEYQDESDNVLPTNYGNKKTICLEPKCISLSYIFLFIILLALLGLIIWMLHELNEVELEYNHTKSALAIILQQNNIGCSI